MRLFRMNLPHLFWFIFCCGALWKIGRLKPDPETDMVRIIIDGPGEIGRISKQDARDVINRVEGIGIEPGGTVGLSTSGHGVVFKIPGEERTQFIAVAMQVWNMLEYWPRKKAALFEEVGGG
ncbi:hypothetical protein DK846_03380 [Methanospirillum lacunae]|uniref:Uncharacterized protein n=2 Tax=Methanospirillum lacunae TaxID=668570 RepID=A0A2V2N1K5_9EURY|nr:hypothetical protein DK846_03380 [Methanospirillum lacunae]